MPPASLSTFAVIKPGPTTAKKSRIRIFQRLKYFMRRFHRHMGGTKARAKRRDRINGVRESGQRKSGGEREKVCGVVVGAASKADSSAFAPLTRRNDIASFRASGGATYSLARRMLITSSEVITPVSLLWSLTTGRVSRLYLSKSSANSLSLAPSRLETSGSWMRESMEVVPSARTILARGTAPTRVPWESTR